MRRYLFTIIFLGIIFNVPSQTCQSGKNIDFKKHQPIESTLASNLRSDTVNILKYTINLEVTDFTNKTIAGNTIVKLTPKINGLSILKLDLLELIVDSIRLNNNSLTYTYNDTLLNVNLGTVFNISDTLNVIIYYHGTPQGDASGWGGFYFQSGFAFNLGVGFAANPHVYGRVWFPCFDNFIERSKYEFNITTNGIKTSYCNGYLAHDTTVSGNRIRKWIMEEEIPTYLASIAVGDYTHVNQSYSGLNGTVPINLIALASDTSAVKSSFVNLNQALTTFENHFGPYMWNKVGFCMVPFNSGAMEHSTNIAYPKSAANGSISSQTLMAHELSHQWFGDLATCRTQEDMWLNEGWASYCENLFTEALHGYDSYLNDVRVRHEKLLQFSIAQEGLLSLSNIPFQHTYGDHVYKKGADVAHTMRGYMGDSLFFYSVKTYLSQNNYKDVSSLDFQNALTTASGINMSDFFNDWVNNPGWTHFSIDSFQINPNGSIFDVKVFVKQKLNQAPNYYKNVPLEITFKSANWIENTQQITMTGAAMNFTLQVPFSPIYVAINKGEKISHAVAPEFKVIKATGNFNFANAKMSLNVLNILDSAFVRIEHNYVAPDSFKSVQPYRLSSKRYWKIDGIVPPTFSSKATFTYDGRTTSFGGTYYLDNDLFVGTANEDSLVLMYRKNTAADWSVYPYYTQNNIANINDKRGVITIDSLQLGEYSLAVKDYLSGITNVSDYEGIVKLFPNPANELLIVEFLNNQHEKNKIYEIVITDILGKQIFNSQINPTSNRIEVATTTFSNGIYFLSVLNNGKKIASNKFIIAH